MPWSFEEFSQVEQEGHDKSKASALTVTEAVEAVKAQVGAMPNLVVSGEVTGFRGPNARSGHCYFQVKDDGAAMDVIVWRGVYSHAGFVLKDGMQIQLTGGFDVYAKQGRLSFIAKHLELAGEGLLRQQVAELARKLEREGLMDPARKRPIPRFCERVCVVTSLSGSVIDDVKRTLARRNPLVALLAAGATVQGPGAPQSLIRGLKVAAAARPDAILLVRGGGSFEDLMTFNDEALARAVAACPVPVITGIGHEPDTTICDMVADRRASTPTAAAESVAPAIDEIEAQMLERRRRLAGALTSTLSKQSQLLEVYEQGAYRSMTYRLASLRSSLEGLAGRRCLQDPAYLVTARKEELLLSEQRLHDAAPRVLARMRTETDDRKRRLDALSARLLRPFEQSVGRSAATLEALSPLKVLGRGYAVMRDDQGRVVSDASRVEVGQEVDVMVGRGHVSAEVTNVFAE